MSDKLFTMSLGDVLYCMGYGHKRDNMTAITGKHRIFHRGYPDTTIAKYTAHECWEAIMSGELYPINDSVEFGG